MSTARRFRGLPPERHLTPKIIELNRESSELEVRRRAAADERARLAHPVRDEEAQKTDRIAMAEAVRSGKAAHSVGTPAADQLAKDRAAVDAEINALAQAVQDVDAEISDAFGELVADPNGMRAAVAAREKYAKAIRALATARTAFYEATALVAYFRAAGADATAVLDEQAPRDAEGWPVSRPPWLRAVETRTRASELSWRDPEPAVSFARYVNHLGIRTADAQLAPHHVVDLFTAEIEETER